MSEGLVNTLVFVFIVVPWGLILGLRLVGRRRGYDSQFARREEPLVDRPLRCRLNLFHRLADHAHPDRGPLPALPGLREDPRHPDRGAAALGATRRRPLAALASGLACVV